MTITEYSKYSDQAEFVSEIKIYDQLNRLIEEQQFHEGELVHKTIQSYFEDGTLHRTKTWDEDGILIIDKENNYSDGQIQLVKSAFPDGSLNYEKHNYSTNQVEVISEDEDGEFDGKIIYDLNTKGQNIAVTRFNYLNKIDSKHLYEYNEQGLVSKIMEVDAKNKPIKGVAYAYNEAGKTTIEALLNRKEQVVDRMIHEYNDGLLIKTSSQERETRYEYENQHLISELQLHPDGSADIITYQYENNRLILEKHYQNPHGQAISEDYLILTKRFEYQ
ncbi:MAG: hypothetical protein JXR60_00695 [Bacteroidales bacterium]|nr:hypothetical protein [Bacteroidales bacterium]